MMKTIRVIFIFVLIFFFHVVAWLPVNAQEHPNLWVRINYATGMTTLVSLPPLPANLPNFTVGQDGGYSLRPGIHPQDFINPQWVTDIERLSTPLSAVIEWSDPTGLGSGIMVAPKHLLTAAHVAISNGQLSPSPTITPAFSGAAAEPTPFGISHAVNAYVPVDYLTHSTNSHIDTEIRSRTDFAIVELDRPVGALSGWLGVQYIIGGDHRELVQLFPPAYLRWNEFYSGTNYLATENLFQWAGYPADQKQGYTGQQMRLWTGDYEFVDAYRLFFNNETGPAGGESGSGAWVTTASGSFVIGIERGTTPEPFYTEDLFGNHYLFSDLYGAGGALSLPNNHFEIHTRITQDYYNAFFQYVPASFPSTPDLIPLDVRVGSRNDPKYPNWAEVVHAGETLPQVRFKVHNYAANGVTWTGPADYQVYLSTDSTIDPTTDRLIASGQITGPLARRSTVSFDTVPVTIPADAGGVGGKLYYIGINIVTPDANTNNNITNGWDTMPIKVLTATTTTTADNTNGSVGEEVTLRAKLTYGSGQKPVNGQLLFFKVGGITFNGTMTDASGVASVKFHIPEGMTGINTITATFNGDTNYDASTGTGRLTVNKAGTSVQVMPLSGAIGHSVVLRSRLTRTTDNANINARTLRFVIAGKVVGSATTNTSGMAEYNYAIPTNIGSGDKTITVEFAGDADYNSASSSGILTVTAPLISATAMLSRSGSKITATISLRNTGTADATDVQITSVTLGPNSTTTSLPYLLGDISQGQSRTADLQFASMPSGTRTVISLYGITKEVSFTATVRVTVP